MPKQFIVFCTYYMISVNSRDSEISTATDSIRGYIWSNVISIFLPARFRLTHKFPFISLTCGMLANILNQAQEIKCICFFTLHLVKWTMSPSLPHPTLPIISWSIQSCQTRSMDNFWQWPRSDWQMVLHLHLAGSLTWAETTTMTTGSESLIYGSELIFANVDLSLP